MADRRPSLPDLGPRGEGWVVAQFLLLGIVAILGLLHLPQAAPAELVDWLALTAGIAEIAIGGWWVIGALRELGSSLTPVPRPLAGGSLVRTGPYAHVRHPVYAGLILAAIGWATLTRSLPAFAAGIVLALLLDAKSRREEGWLSEKYPDYGSYRRVTWRFLRGIY